MSFACAIPGCGRPVRPAVLCAQHMATWLASPEYLALEKDAAGKVVDSIDIINAALQRFIASVRRCP